ncbi:ABC transporter substrate-binding protein [Microlunatus sp. GCM10028923]|uniref:ABC transporter substrate-binding protein n=1 Tax=Microlunatus sp. GCM10028923 TaxID=3273400 RepID=UPI00361E3112
MSVLSRRGMLGAMAGLAGLGLVGCGRSGTAGPGGGSVRFAWWGNDYLNRQTQAVIDLFTSRHPDIPVAPEPGEWGSYWDKLATMTAANDAPDVINMDQKYIAEYGERGALMNLREATGLELGTIDDQALAAGSYTDKLYGISTGQNAYTVVANPRLFADAGLELPDDKTWTWDDYREAATKIGQESGGKIIGTAYGINEAYLIIWLRQHGEQLYTPDGKLGYRPETLINFFAELLALMEAGAGPAAEHYVEEADASLEQSAFGTNRAAMTWYWTNQLGSLEGTSGSDLVQLRPPSRTGQAADNGLYYKPSMFWSLSARTERRDQAITFLNFLVNDPDAAKTLLVDRGAPINRATRPAVEQALRPVDLRSLQFLDALAGEIKDAPPVPPVGASDVQNVLKRYVSDVFFTKLSPEQAAEKFTTEVQGMLDAG